MSKPITVGTTNANQAGDCTVTMTIDVVGSSSRQMVGPGGATIAYTIAGLPIRMPGPGNSPPGRPNTGWATWFGPGQLTGTIQPSAYVDAPAGNYTDSVTIRVTP